jgi:hypothetical protein
MYAHGNSTTEPGGPHAREDGTHQIPCITFLLEFPSSFSQLTFPDEVEWYTMAELVLSSITM